MYTYTHAQVHLCVLRYLPRTGRPFAFFPPAVFSVDAKLDFPVAGAGVVDVALIRSPRNATALISER